MMHPNSMNLMRHFVEKYVTLPCSVADIGSCDMNGTFKPLFEGCEYEGLDIIEGPNVDRVVEPYDFGDKAYDTVISGNTMEHIQDLHKWTEEIIRICKPGGLICITAPHTWKEHRYTLEGHRFFVDCWRILPDGMNFLFRSVKILECRKQENDTLLVAQIDE